MSLPLLKWVPSPNFSSRRGSRVDLLVLHDTEGSYGSAINWFRMPQSKVSAHFVIKEDGTEGTQMVDICDKAWHACNANPRSVGFEMAGFSKKGFGSPEWDALAHIFAFHLHFLQIPLRHARSGVGPGICSHFELGAFGGGHSDPSTDPNVMAAFFTRLEDAYNHHDFPPVWTHEHDLSGCPLKAPAA